MDQNACDVVDLSNSQVTNHECAAEYTGQLRVATTRSDRRIRATGTNNEGRVAGGRDNCGCMAGFPIGAGVSCFYSQIEAMGIPRKSSILKCF